MNRRDAVSRSTDEGSSHSAIEYDTAIRRALRNVGRGWFVAMLAVPLVVTGVATRVTTDRLEADLTVRTQQALIRGGFRDVKVRFEGRDGTVSLPVGSETGIARDIGRGIEGVRVLKVTAPLVKEPASPIDPASPFQLSSGDRTLTIQATVPTNLIKRNLLRTLANAVAPANVVDRITVDSASAGPAQTPIGNLARALLAETAGVAAKWDGSKLTLTGVVRTEAARATIRAAAKKAARTGEVVDNLTLITAGGASCGGIQIKLNAVLKDNKIQFEESSPELTAGSKSTVNKVATLLAGCVAVKIEVAGHTDNQGSSAASRPLSEARARQVKSELQLLGIAAGRITTKSYGESEPIESNDTEAGRAANRRVEIRVL